MKIKINYLENAIDISNEHIFSLEIENKSYFYRCVNDFVSVSNGEISDNIYCYNGSNEEVILTNKIEVVSDYFNFNLLLKNYSSNLSKFISNECDEITRDKLTSDYKKIRNSFSKFLSNIELPLNINEEFNLDLLIKILKPTIVTGNNLLENLFLLIEIEKLFNLNKMIVFINLKQYLNKEELIELYKYSLYNKVNILLIDSQSYGPTLENEKKVIVDENLDEIVI